MDEKLLISAVQKHPIIYDRSRPDFKDVVKRRCSWDIISKALNVPVNQCMRAWRNVRERYGRELKILRTNPDDSAEVVPKWDLFENLSFLKTHIKARKRANSYSHASTRLDERILIEIVEKYPMIYDKHDMDFKNIIKKEECWNEIAGTLGVPAKDCEHIWKNLRERYAKERKRLHITQEIISRWPLYNSLTFLDCHIKPRRTNNLTLKTESWNSDTDMIDINHKTETPDFEFVEESQVLDDMSEIPETPEKMTLSNIDSSPIAPSSILIQAPKAPNEHGYVNLIPSNYVESGNQGTSSDIAFGNYVGQYLSELADIKKKNKLKLSIMQLLHGDE